MTGDRPERWGGSRHLRRIWLAAVAAVTVGFAAVVAIAGLSTIRAVRTGEEVALGLLGSALLVGVVALIAVRVGAWREPESESEFEQIVLRSERLAREGLAVEPDEEEFLALDPFDDRDFAELVREALDELPDLLRNTLRNLAVVVSDQGRRHGAYGLYEGDGAARDGAHDRIIIFRDTLRRDFGEDPELLREQVTRTVRHELAHHVGFDELGVSMLDL